LSPRVGWRRRTPLEEVELGSPGACRWWRETTPGCRIWLPAVQGRRVDALRRVVARRPHERFGATRTGKPGFHAYGRSVGDRRRREASVTPCAPSLLRRL